MRRLRSRGLPWCLAAGAAVVTPLHGQSTPDEPDPQAVPGAWRGAPLATLSLWAEDVWISLLDRDGSWFGRLGEEGVFQRFNDLMDDEYELDVRSSMFTPGEDARWARLSNGFRGAGASISHPHVLNRIDWRQEIAVTRGVDALARYRRERSFTAQRDYPRIGVRWRDALGSPLAVEAGLGVHFFKPSADLELALSSAWRSREGGAWSVELRMAALDAFNNTIFNLLGVRDDVEAHLDYRTSPVAARGALRHRSPLWLLEVHGGATNQSDVAVSFPTTDDPGFTQREQVSFAGALVQATPGDRLSVAVYGSLARADTEREGSTAEPAGGFGLREETSRVGIRQRTVLTGTVAIEAELDRVWRPEHRTPRDAPRVEHEDRTTFGQLVLLRRPLAGWTGRLAYAVIDRDAGVLAPKLTAAHRRLVTAAGYRFASGFEVTGGAAWDIDAFGRRRFDGGHLRFSGTW